MPQLARRMWFKQCIITPMTTFAAQAVRRAAIYARKSTEDARNPGKSIADQTREARAEVERRGWMLDDGHVFEDSGISASRHARGKARPGFDSLLDAIENGEIDAVVLAELSRASRRMSVVGVLVELCQATGTLLVIGGREVDLTNPADLLLVSVESGMAAGESERLSLRARRGARGQAQAGKPAGKNMLGYQRIYDDRTKALLAVEPVPDEAAVVREVCTRLLRGDSMREIAQDFNARGVPSPYDFVAVRQGRAPKGAKWTGEQVKRVAVNPAYAGLRVHNPKDGARSVTVAVWPALVTSAEHERLVAQLTDPKRRSNCGTRPGAVVHWLSGVAQCGECKSKLRVLTNRGKYRHYTCVRPGCMKVSRTAGPVERFVQEVIFALLDNPTVLAAANGQQGDDAVDAAMDAVQVLTARRDEVRGQVVAGALSASDASAILVALGDEIVRAEEKVRALSLPKRAADLDLDGLRDRWEDLSPARKRSIADALVTVEVLSMHGRRSNRFDPATVLVRPRWETLRR